MGDAATPPPLAPVQKIVADVVEGKISETLACFLIEKHLEHARAPRGVTRRDQIAALVLPAIMQKADRDHPTMNGNLPAYEDYCWRRAYGMADAGDRNRG